MTENKDFYWKEIDNIRFKVFTEEYLLKNKKVCCQNNCPNCPWRKDRKIKTLTICGTESHF